MNRAELEKLADLIREYSIKYNCRLELESTEITRCMDIEPKYHYKLIAISEERMEC